MSKYQVCPACDGEGYTSILGAFTGADVDEWYGDDTDAREDFARAYTTRGGAYDERCHACKGARVVTDAEMAAYDEWCESETTCQAESYCHA